MNSARSVSMRRVSTPVHRKKPYQFRSLRSADKSEGGQSHFKGRAKTYSGRAQRKPAFRRETSNRLPACLHGRRAKFNQIRRYIRRKVFTPIHRWNERHRVKCMAALAVVQLAAVLFLAAQGSLSLSPLLTACVKTFEAVWTCTSAGLGFIGAVASIITIAFPTNTPLLFTHVIFTLLGFLGVGRCVVYSGLMEAACINVPHIRGCGQTTSVQNKDYYFKKDFTMNSTIIETDSSELWNSTSDSLSVMETPIDFCEVEVYKTFITTIVLTGLLYMLSSLALCQQWNYYGTARTTNAARQDIHITVQPPVELRPPFVTVTAV